MNSKDLRHLYDREYFLKRVEGWKHYAKKEIYPKKIDSAERLPFRGKSVLDVGFGRGEIMRYCYKNGARYVHGIDYSPDAVEISKTTLKGCDDVVAEIGDLETHKWDTAFDCVYLVDVVEHVTRPELALFMRNLNLNKGAMILIETPCYDHGDYKGMHINYMDEAEIHDLLLMRCSKTITIPDEHWWICIGTV